MSTHQERGDRLQITHSSGHSHTGRIGRHHFSHLRGIAEGISVPVCAGSYLGIHHGHQAMNAHYQTVDAVRAIARRHKEPAWRLIGLLIRDRTSSNIPTLEDFIAERNLNGWSEDEVREMHAEAYPAIGGGEPKAKRREKLRKTQLALLDRLEELLTDAPSPTDLVSGWFDNATAKKLIEAGMLTLGDLRQKIAVGGRWYSGMPGVGKTKATRIASFLFTLLGHIPSQAKSVFALAATDGASLPVAPVVRLAGTASSRPALLAVTNDVEAVHAWISARAGSELTAIAYKREATRLILWLQYERQHKALASMSVGDCGDYMAFLQNIPQHWISRVRASPGQVGWAPFRGQLSHRSHQRSIVIVASLFTWLHAAQYLHANPWLLVNQKTGDDRAERMLDTKALSEVAEAEILRFIELQPPSPSRDRIRFILRFVGAVGLRSAELLNARLGDLRLEPEGWVMQIHGKGAKNRLAAIPGQAFAALQQYLSLRGLDGIETAPPETHLLSSTVDPVKPVGYQALYEHVKGWITKAVRASALPSNERQKLAGASTHWLRHTFGTRAIAREVPLDVIQAQLGHSSIQTTSSIYGRAPIKRRSHELGKAFG